jgi:hypothetical protein
MGNPPYPHVCGNTGTTHRGLCNACVWEEAYLVGYRAAVQAHDASGCPQIFMDKST